MQVNRKKVRIIGGYGSKGKLPEHCGHGTSLERVLGEAWKNALFGVAYGWE